MEGDSENVKVEISENGKHTDHKKEDMSDNDQNTENVKEEMTENGQQAEVQNTEKVQEEVTQSQTEMDHNLGHEEGESSVNTRIHNNLGTDEEEDVITVNPEVIEKLTTGVLGLFLPNLQKARGTLNDCLSNQEVLIETIQQENAKFSESTAMQQLINTMQQARVYQSKLINLKKEMNTLTDRSMKIKKRAVRLQQQKQKEDLERAARKDRESEKERMLTAKVAKKVAK